MARAKRAPRRATSSSWSFNAAGVIDGLRAVANNPNDVMRPSLYAGVKVMYDAATLAAAAISPGKTGTGRLARSIYHVFSQDNSDQTRVTYHVSWRKSTVAYNAAPHGFLLEWGFERRYQAIRLKNGNWVTLKSPEARKNGWSKPPRSASQATKDAYYRVRKNPVIEEGNFFLRDTYIMRYQDAVQAVQDAFPLEYRRALGLG